MGRDHRDQPVRGLPRHRAAVPGMKARKWGRIINTASAHSLVASPFKSAYVAAKHGIAGLTKTVALELATFGITVNCISPGYVWTPLVEKQIPDTMKARNMTKEQVINDVLLAAQPTKQFVTVEQVARARALPLLRRGLPDHRRQPLDRRRLDGGMTGRCPGTPRPAPRLARASPGRRPRKRISLALQGGGAHGAFTWGVLDALLEDGRLAIEAITGTSAGAMNAVVLVEGWLEGGRGRRAGAARGSSGAGQPRRPLSAPAAQPVRPLRSATGRTSSGPISMRLAWRSPYEANPLEHQPAARRSRRRDRFRARARAARQFKLFVSATNVWTGKSRSSREELTADHVLASACLPTMFQAVEIDGEPYWDGGYMGNPALFPLFYETLTDDILIVQINPSSAERHAAQRERDPEPPDEITFNGAPPARIARDRFRQDAPHRQGKLSKDEYKPSSCTASTAPARSTTSSLLAPQRRMGFLPPPARCRPRHGKAVAGETFRRDRA